MRFLTSPVLSLSLLLLALAGCTSHSPYGGGPFAEKDGVPRDVRDWHRIPDATPRWEPRARYGNHSPYEVFGKTYHVMDSARGYRETGVASWYGRKFSGRPTSSQEPYDPHAMTAAHKSLPLPSYVRVTNLDNQRQVIVRVNDRGPFHDDRIIDLSYAAAHKLGYASQGTARVLVEAITPPPPGQQQAHSTPAPTQSIPTPPDSGAAASATAGAVPHRAGYYLQVGAFRDLESAQSLRQRLVALTSAPVAIHSASERGTSGVHRVRIGPFANEHAARNIENQLGDSLSDPLLIRR
ncbi:MAG: septal ring lytic transglycosylase RlpA family protein [Pseudomonadota bacterium]|nr:septal ring lytic transglycosylase RlpA family protein [Pseudomonadota bacterium]